MGGVVGLLVGSSGRFAGVPAGVVRARRTLPGADELDVGWHGEVWTEYVAEYPRLRRPERAKNV